jgi:hypothetical protein
LGDSFFFWGGGISKVAQKFLFLFSEAKIPNPKVTKVMTKDGLGYILGDFFTNSSGHPASFIGSDSLLPGRPDEFVKKSPKMKPNPFFVLVNTQLVPWKKVDQNLGYF